MDEIASIKTFFQSHNVPLSTAWIEGCVNWCKEENLPANYTPKDLQLKVFEQWLLLDLRDVEVPCLPPDLSSKIKYTLNGNYSLQMMKMVDISKPKYWQIQRIRNDDFKNVDPENESSKRVLQMTLTDGVQEVEATEYKPISCLNLNLSPGIKIRLMGPIIVRRGRLMLEDKNVKVLGGEVEDLIVPNAAENILAAALQLPLNSKPNVIQESLLTANSDMFTNTGQNTTVGQNQINVRRNVVNPSISNKSLRETQHTKIASVPSTSRQNYSEINHSRITSVPSTSRQNYSEINHNRVTSMPSTSRQSYGEMMDLDDDEELRIAEQIDRMMETERDITNSPAKKRKTNKTPDMFEDVDFDDSVFENIEIPSLVQKTSEPAKTKTVINTKKRPLNANIDDSFDFGNNELFENVDFDTQLDQPTKKSNWKPGTSQKPAVLTIEKLKKNIPNISFGKFRIKATYSSIVERLTMADSEYHLVIQVRDDTGYLDVKVHTDLISDFAGYCAAAIISLRTEILEHNAEAEAKMLKVLKRIKDKLLELNHIVEVQISSKEKFPVILNIVE